MIIRQPYIEGMLPYEYAFILRTLQKLRCPSINVYFEAQPVHDDSLAGYVHRVRYYFNKRFYKYS